LTGLKLAKSLAIRLYFETLVDLPTLLVSLAKKYV